jgi:phosphoglycerate kinase
MQFLSQKINELSGKSVIVRANFDVPVVDGQVKDTTRLKDSLPTIKLLRLHNCPVTLIAHLERPEGYDPQYSLKPIAHSLESLLGESVMFIPYDQTKTSASFKHSIQLLDNLRFFPGEEAKDTQFAKMLSDYGQVYVNESFATSHRDHASITLLPKLLPGYLGLSFETELLALQTVIDHPKKPLVIVLGGAKLETKEPLVEAFKDVADHILVGGKIAVDLQAKHSSLPPNVKVATLIPSGKDITVESALAFAHIIKSAQTVIWNGTMGVFEDHEFQQGTKIVADAVNHTPAYTLVGGGDTETALTLLDAEQNISHISSGGGAMLTYLLTHSLLGLEALQ